MFNVVKSSLFTFLIGCILPVLAYADENLPVCHLADMKLEDSDIGDGAGGHTAEGYYLKNISAKACTLNGYPDIKFLNAQEKELPFRVIHGGGFIYEEVAPKPFTLAPSQKALFILERYRCDEGTKEKSSFMEISLPQDSRKILTSDKQSLCKGGETVISVSPFQNDPSQK